MAVAALMSFDTQIGQGGRSFMPKVMTHWFAISFDLSSEQRGQGFPDYLPSYPGARIMKQ